MTPTDQRELNARNARAKRLIDRAKEIEKSGAVEDRLIAKALYAEARDLSSTVIRDIEKVFPELEKIRRRRA